MAELIKMPRLSDTMTEGVIAAWHVKVGDKVQSGDLLAEVETDKATMDVESFFDGTVLHIGVSEGNGIPVGDLLIIIGEEGEDVSDLVSNFQAEAPAEHAEAEAEASAQPEPQEQEAAPVPVSNPVSSAPTPAPQLVSSEGGDTRIKASPLAKAMAKEKGIDLKHVNGSGDHGRIIKRDIENYQPAAETAADTQPHQPMRIVGQENFEEVATSQMRKTIARRLSESKFTAPHFYLTMEINMDKTVAVRKSLNEISSIKISYNDMIIKAVAAALRQHPNVNASWLGDKIRYNHHIHIGMAVAVEEGLLVPVIRHADQLGLSTIASESKRLAGMARDRKLQPSDWEGNTFTISNLGMFGIDEFTAIINPPDACIMAIGGIAEKPIVKDGEIVPGHLMKVTLSCDHRVVDGATGSAFLVTFRQMMEDPLRIML